MQTKKKMILLLTIVILSVSLIITYLYSKYDTYKNAKTIEHLKEIKTSAPPILDLPAHSEIIVDEPQFSKASFSYTKNPNREILSENTDYVGWIKIENTRIDHPVLRGKDNSYYLNRRFDHTESDLGSIFMDYRNIGQFIDQHTAIYGHYKKDGSMFADLHQYKSIDFFNENKIITIEGLYKTQTYTIFSAYIVSADDYVIDLETGENNYEHYLSSIAEKSMHPSTHPLDSSKKLLTLTTCSYEINNGRIIIHAIEN